MKKIANLVHKVLYDNKLLMIFSLVFAVCVWLAVAISFSPIDTAVIKNVPVKIDLTNSVPAQFDLEIFGQADFAVDVEVSGKRYIVNSKSVNADSVRVIAQTAYVDSAGKHTLALKISKVNENDEFEIVSVSEDFVEVYFDVYKELEFPIEPRVICESDDLTKSGYIADEPFLSADTVTISGPATEVDSVSKVCAEMTIERALSETRTQAADIKAYNENGGVIHYLTFNYSNSEVTITQPVYYVVSKPASVDFKHIPVAYINNFEYSVYPESVEAGLQGISEDSAPETISIATIDFARLKPGENVITVDASEIPSLMIVDGTTEFTVTITLENCSQRMLSVPVENISFINAPKGYDTSSLYKTMDQVIVAGPYESISKLQSADIYAVVDLADVDSTAIEQSMPAKLSIKNSEDCWVSGEYSVKISKTN